MQISSEICTIPFIMFLIGSVLKLIPGYSGIQQYGRRSFLAIALFFMLLLDIFAVVSFYWTALITPHQRFVSVIALIPIWGTLMAFDAHIKGKINALKPEENDLTFRQTICHYLRGDWTAAESLMYPYLKKYPKDIEMLLMQAAMYRHMERYEEALFVLDKLQLLQNSRHWWIEINTERSLIADAMREA